MMNKKYAWALLLFFFMPTAALAAAWVKPKNGYVLINNFDYYVSTQFYDTSGQLTPTDIPYREATLNTYFEYGVTDKITVGLSSYAYNAGQANVQTGFDMLATDLFAQYQIWHHWWDEVSFKFDVYVPYQPDPFPFTEQATISNGQSYYQYSVGGTLLYGTGGDLKNFFNYSWYLSTEVGYTQNFAPASGQISVDFNLGVKTPDDHWLVEVKSFNSMATNMPFQNGSFQNFDLYTISAGLTYFFNKYVGIEAGYISALGGTNIGQGDAPFVALWIKDYK